METKTSTNKKILLKRISKTERHIRWNWEVSPREMMADKGKMVRYHFIVVDDKDRDIIMGKIIEQFATHPFSSPLYCVREREGKVAGSELRYLFQSYDTLMSPKTLRWEEIGRPVKKDPELNERTKPGHSIEQYVQNIYSD